VWRDYYVPPYRVKYDPKTGKQEAAYEYVLGKLGTEIEAFELHKVSRAINRLGKRKDENGEIIKYNILPDCALSDNKSDKPTEIKTYQLMGRTIEGDICPCLSTAKENIQTKHGSLACLIYEDRPLLCRSYPCHALYQKQVSKNDLMTLAKYDTKCFWISEQIIRGYDSLKSLTPVSDISGVDYGAMLRIQKFQKCDKEKKILWRYATGVHSNEMRGKVNYVGWIKWGWF
jgi:Fe-S-cluster containining protein